MDIHAPHGTTVIYLGKNGYDRDREHADKFMDVGDVWTVDHTEIGNWHTDVIFCEIPGQRFNSVMFEEVALTT